MNRDHALRKSGQHASEALSSSWAAERMENGAGSAAAARVITREAESSASIEADRVLLHGWRRTADRASALADCTLVIATYRRPAEVAGLLEALAGLPDCPGEVIVVDGSPDDGTARAAAAVARRGGLPFDLVYIDSPSGLTRQRNVGIDAGRGDIVFFLDDDCTPRPGYFGSLRRLFDADPAVGGVRGTFVEKEERPLQMRVRLRRALRLVPAVQAGEFSATATTASCSTVGPFTGERPVQILPGGASAYRRAVFDEHRFSSFFDGYSQGEDVEMSVRVGARWKFLWSGDARVLHSPAQAGRPRPFARGRMEVRNRHFIWLRHVLRRRPVDRARFWADVAFAGACDLVELARGRSGLHPLLHLCGLAAGAAGSLLRPVRYTEPPARRQYDFEFRDVPPEQAP